MQENLFVQALILILTCAGLVFLFVRFGLPTVFGYLAAGVAIGPRGFGLLTFGDGVTFFGDMGVVLLLFMIGLEFSLPKLIAARRTVFGMGGAQVALTTAAIAVGAKLLGYDGRMALVLGGVVAMSSTAVVLKELADQGELSTDDGRAAVGILLFQDLASLPFLVLVDAWVAGDGGGRSRIAVQLLIAALAFGAVGFLSRLLFKRILACVVGLRSSELTLLTTLGSALGTAFVTHRFGMAPSVGAFLAGMVIGETDYRHQVEDDIRPFRDLLVGIFFVTVGTRIDPSVLSSAPLSVLAWLGLLLSKTVFVAVAVWFAGGSTRAAIRTAFCLAEGGEFGLLLLALATEGGIIAGNVGQSGMVAVALSIGLAPLLVRRNEQIARAITGKKHHSDSVVAEQTVRGRVGGMNDHAILLGCGRVGRLVARVLETAGLPYVAVENNVDQFRRAKGLGHEVVLADASHSRILDAAGLDRARLLVVTFDHPRMLERILHHAHEEARDVPVLVSARDELKLSDIHEAGASHVFPENFAAGLALGAQALVLLGFSHDDAAGIVAGTRVALNPNIAAVRGSMPRQRRLSIDARDAP